jgi:hypothetical protein
MEFQPDLNLTDLSPQLLLALMECEQIYKKRLLTLTLEGVGEFSLRLRTKGTGSTMSLLGDIKRKLLPAGYEVMAMHEGLDNEHIRVVYFKE